MSVYKDATFSINRYDSDGDVVEECVQIHLGYTVLEFSNVKQIDAFAKQLKVISKEIKANY